MEKQILHIDVNNAFLSWTAIDRLKKGEEIDIREIPAIIGGDETKRSGIVLAKSMKAKECRSSYCRNNLSGQIKVSKSTNFQFKL